MLGLGGGVIGVIIAFAVLVVLGGYAIYWFVWKER